MKWSQYQEKIFDAVAGGHNDLIVQARAGSAKTTTIIESLVYVPENESVMLVAFNKSVEQQLSKHAPDGVEVRTFHAYGMRALSKKIGSFKIDSNKTRSLCRAQYDDQLTREVGWGLVRAVSACKNLLASTPEEIEDALYRMDIDTGIVFPKHKLAGTSTQDVLEWLNEEYLKFIKRVGELLKASQVVSGVIDFDDMVWLPHVLDIPTFVYDRIFVDEAQDVNPAQVALIERGLGDDGIRTAIGDDRQAIYGWRGADLRAMQLAGADRLGLPICYRCGKEIVRVAQTIVPDIQVWSEAADGEVLHHPDESIVEMIKEGDFILSRTNAPLMKLWLCLVGLGKPARILGRSVGYRLASFIKGSKTETVKDLLEYTDRWLRVEMARLAARKRNVEPAQDMAKCVEYLSQGAETVAVVLRRIDEVFTQHADRSDRIILSTVHQAKGLERKRVFVLMNTFCWRPTVEEQNLFYVAVTRAKDVLVLVSDADDDLGRCTRT